MHCRLVTSTASPVTTSSIARVKPCLGLSGTSHRPLRIGSMGSLTKWCAMAWPWHSILHASPSLGAGDSPVPWRGRSGIAPHASCSALTSCTHSCTENMRPAVPKRPQPARKPRGCPSAWSHRPRSSSGSVVPSTFSATTSCAGSQGGFKECARRRTRRARSIRPAVRTMQPWCARHSARRAASLCAMPNARPRTPKSPNDVHLGVETRSTAGPAAVRSSTSSMSSGGHSFGGSRLRRKGLNASIAARGDENGANTGSATTAALHTPGTQAADSQLRHAHATDATSAGRKNCSTRRSGSAGRPSQPHKLFLVTNRMVVCRRAPEAGP